MSEGALHCFRLVLDDQQKGSGRALRTASALLPVAQCTLRNPEPSREFVLCQFKSPTNLSHVDVGRYMYAVIFRVSFTARKCESLLGPLQNTRSGPSDLFHFCLRRSA